MVDPSSIEETIEILKNVRDKYESFHKVSYDDEIIEVCVKLADRYITDREFPDKAFDIMDEVGAKVKTQMKIPESIEELKKLAAEIKQQKIDVVKKQNYEKAAELRDKEKKLITKLDGEKKKFEETQMKEKRKITLEEVYDVVSNMTKIPISKLNTDESKSLSNLEEILSSKVVGQKEAVSKIAKSIRRNRLGIKDPNKPIGSFIFLGKGIRFSVS